MRNPRKKVAHLCRITRLSQQTESATGGTTESATGGTKAMTI